MSKSAAYRELLRGQKDWDTYLLAESGLPGPRGNLELAQAAADEGDEARFRHWLSFDATTAPANTPGEFLAVCGAIGLGRLLAQGQGAVLVDLRRLAADPRWRVREGVAMALQRWGDADMPALLDEMQKWSRGSPLEQRAVVAALCEPPCLLDEPIYARQTLLLLDHITTALAQVADRRAEAVRVLRQTLGYGWSVATVALPAEGQALMEKWLASPDHDVRWIMRENLKKSRLARLDPAWVARWRTA